MKLGERIWHSKRISGANSQVAKFSKPTEIINKLGYFSCMPNSSGGLTLIQSGEMLSNYWTIIANAKYFSGKINVGDVFWVDGDEPIEEIETKYGNGSSATAVVEAVNPVNLGIRITLKRNQKQKK